VPDTSTHSTPRAPHPPLLIGVLLGIKGTLRKKTYTRPAAGVDGAELCDPVRGECVVSQDQRPTEPTTPCGRTIPTRPTTYWHADHPTHGPLELLHSRTDPLTHWPT